MQYFYDLGASKYHVIPTSEESKGFPKGLDTNLETGAIGMPKYGNYGKVATLVNPLFANFTAGKIDVNTYTTQATQLIDQNLTQKTAGIELKLAANPYAPRRAPWL